MCSCIYPWFTEVPPKLLLTVSGRRKLASGAREFVNAMQVGAGAGPCHDAPLSSLGGGEPQTGWHTKELLRGLAEGDLRWGRLVFTFASL